MLAIATTFDVPSRSATLGANGRRSTLGWAVRWGVLHVSVILLLIAADEWLYAHVRPLLLSALMRHVNTITPNALGSMFRLVGLWPTAALALVALWREHPRGIVWCVTILIACLGTLAFVEVASRCVGHMRPSQSDGKTVFVPFNAWHDEHRWGASFPASEPAVAMVLMVILSRAFPRLQRVFLGLAVGSGLIRIASAGHFPSDIYAAWLVGYCFARGALSSRRLPTMCDNLSRAVYRRWYSFR